MMKKRLVLVLDNYPYTDGEYPFIKTELRYLKEAFDVSILCTSPEDHQEKKTDPGIKVYHLKLKFGLREKIKAVVSWLFCKEGRAELKDILKCKENVSGRIYSSISYYGCAREVSDYARKNILIDRSENILIYSYWFNSSCLGFLINKERYPGMKVVSRIHGYDLYEDRNPYGRQPFRKHMDRTIDGLYFVAQSGMDYYFRNYPFAQKTDKYAVCPIGTEITGDTVSSDTTINAGSKCFELVSCASCIPLKRIDLIIEALAEMNDDELSDRPIRWIHYGDGELFDELKTMADNRLSKHKNISYEFKGQVDNNEIRSHYAKGCTNGFILVSSTEGCPVSIQEAISYGIPVIGTDVGEVSNMIKGAGYLLPGDPSVEDIRKAIVQLIIDSNSYEKYKMLRNTAINNWSAMYDGKANAACFTTRLLDV